ncbi:MAG: 50S ribosomal protein L3 [Candidatus Latescibacterota bacterium]|nr:MAG: 50S ribosomal protein L3 [Candidatus Latescibacterota bacterium]
MPIGILGKKIGMTQRFDDGGHIVPVTIVEVAPCPIVQKKTVQTDGYNAIQIGYGSRKKSRTTRALAGHVKKAGVEPVRALREIRFPEGEFEGFEPGTSLGLDLFEKGEFVDVTAQTIGRGFAGVIKKHGFSGKNMTHGTHEYFRHGGSIGMCATPGRLFKGKKMPGHMGAVRRTVQNLRIVDVKKEQNLLYVLGAVPGARNAMVLIRKSVKKAAAKKS